MALEIPRRVILSRMREFLPLAGSDAVFIGHPGLC